ncbi:hypothetical protein GNP67_01370 [Aliivibrio fischeri]|nr:hypothetical protein [Aliivibrio fischeri]
MNIMIKRTSKLKIILAVLTSLLLISCKNDDDTKEDHSNISTITITPKEVPTRGVSGYVLRPGQQLELIATAENRDNTTLDITKYVTWHSTFPEAVKMNGSTVVGMDIGEAEISARYNGIESSDSIHVKVVYGKIKNLRITPTIISVSKMFPIQLKLTSVFRDHTTADVHTRRWSSSNEEVASVSIAGLVTPKNVGETTITARKGGKKATAKITVTDAKLEKITIFPLKVITPLGQKSDLTAVGTLSDHTTLKINSSVTWKSTDEQIATVSNQGEITLKKVGKVNITATKDGISGTSQLEVLPAKIAKIMIEPGNKIKTPLGREIKFTVSGILTDGRKVENLVTKVRLLPTNAATMRHEEGKPSVLVPVAPGEATVTATVDGHIATSTITITSEVLERITITSEENTTSVPLNKTLQLTAKGIFSNSNKPKDITNVAWDTTKYDVIALDNKGKVTPLKEGSADVIATKDSIQATVTITVEPEKIASISFKDKISYIVEGRPSMPLKVMGINDNGDQRPLKNTLTYSSSDPTIASVVSGQIRPKKPGIATISVMYTIISNEGKKRLLSDKMNITVLKTPMSKGFPCDGNNHEFDCLNPIRIKNDSIFTPTPEKLFFHKKAGDNTANSVKYGLEDNPLNSFYGTAVMYQDAEKWCETLNKIRHQYIDNWRLPTQDELLKFYEEFNYNNDLSSLIDKYHWPHGLAYQVESKDSDTTINLVNKTHRTSTNSPSTYYTSCISENESL